MKKIIYCLLAACLAITLFPIQASAATTDKPSSLVVTKPPEPVESAEIKSLLKRADMFNTTNDSKLIPKEKKSTQIEVRSEGRHHRNGGVVYVSAGAIILVVILLVILL
ncbi:MAG: hypothetical protein WA816_00655 [Bacteroidales bacterium]